MLPELKVFFAAMTPFLDLKLAIPLGIELNLSIVTTIFFATAGTIFIPAILLPFGEPISKFLMEKSQFCDKCLSALFHKTRTKHSEKFNRYGAIFIYLFVAIPLPGSGAASGALLSFLFGVDYWKAIFLISIGTITASIIVTAGFGSVMKLLETI